MKWFRFYHEFVDDPKIAMMSDSDQLIWVKALCLASESKNRGIIQLTDEEICWKLRTTLEIWKHAIDKFRAKGMIEHCESGYKIINWDKRQFESDSSAERVAKHRKNNPKPKKKKCNVTSPLPKQSGNGGCNKSVSPPDTDYRSREQIQKEEDIYPGSRSISSESEPQNEPEQIANAIAREIEAVECEIVEDDDPTLPGLQVAVLEVKESEPKKKTRLLVQGQQKSDFEQFWEATVWKTAKKDAEKAFAGIKGVAIAQIVDAWQYQQRWHLEKKGTLQYLKRPGAWLRQRGWEDQMEPVAEAGINSKSVTQNAELQRRISQMQAKYATN